jgi:lysophospholipid acyltransferase (LPLAT)-like uncharacterized protein
LVPSIIYVLLHLIWWSTRKKFHIVGSIEDRQYVSLSWHSELLFSPKVYKKLHPTHTAYAIASSHFDGTLISRVLEMLGIQTLRGSTNKRAKQVLIQAIRCAREGNDLLLTPDGPRGPRHSMSAGAVGIAQKAGVPLMLVNYIPQRYKQLNSWDRFVIPLPFSKVDIYVQSVSIEGMGVEEAKVFLSDKMMKYTLT